jgi:hypothetical protein
MRKVLLILVLVVSVFSACKKEIQDNDLTGKWKLTEYLADPGDGSGTWRPASNSQFIEFLEDGTLIFSPSGQYDSKRYNVTSDSTIIFSGGPYDSPIRYNLSGNMLTLNPQCIERCGMKYVKVSD